MEKVIAIALVAGILGLAYTAIHANEKWNACTQKGGYTVELKTGYVCAKLEIIR